MNITGLDLSLSSTGVALPDRTFVTIRPHGAGYARHWNIGERLLRIIPDATTDLVVLEDYAPHGAGINALIAVAEIGGIIRAMLTRQATPFVLVRPSTLKLYATGKGAAKKPAMLKAALDDFPFQPAIEGTFPANHDEADAYWLRHLGLAWAAGARDAILDGLPPHRRRALETVKWPDTLRARAP